MADAKQGEGVERAVACLLRACGGGGVVLRVPGPAAGGDEAEALGLAAPQWQDVELVPAVLRSSRGEVLVAAGAVRHAMGSLGFGASQALFAGAVGVVIGDEVRPVKTLHEVEAAGVVVAYRVVLAAPDA